RLVEVTRLIEDEGGEMLGSPRCVAIAASSFREDNQLLWREEKSQERQGPLCFLAVSPLEESVCLASKDESPERNRNILKISLALLHSKNKAASFSHKLEIAS